MELRHVNNKLSFRGSYNEGGRYEAQRHILLYGPIGSGKSVEARHFVSELYYLAHTANEICVHINSEGGSVFDALAIANAMKQIQSTGVIVSTVVDGFAMSSAQFIAASGTPGKRYVADISREMVHEPFLSGVPEENMDENTKKMFYSVRDTVFESITAASKMTEAEVIDMCKKTTYLNADQAIQAGFADQKISYGASEKVKNAEKVLSAAPSGTAYIDAVLAMFSEETKPVQKPEIKMELKEILAALSLPETSNIGDVKSEIANLKSKVVLLEDQRNLSADQLKAANAKNSELQKIVDEIKLKEAEAFVDQAIKECKINAEQKAKFIESYIKDVDFTKGLIAGIVAPTALSEMIETKGKNAKAEARADWTLIKWMQEDPEGLVEMEQNDPDKYKALAEKATKF